MDLGKSPLFSMITKRLDWLVRRQQVLAHNIANSDTPGFKARDIAPLDFRRLADSESRRVEVSATDARHLSLHRRSAGSGLRAQSGTQETTPSGNTVVLEEQLLKVSETVMDYQLTTNLYRKHMNMIRMALGRNG